MSTENQTISRRQWRSMVKKLRRKKMRQKSAQERDFLLEKEENNRLKDPLYQSWLQQQSEFEAFQREAEAQQQLAAEEQWLYREKIAQQQFRIERERQQAEEAQREAARLEQEKIFQEQEEQKRKRREEKQRLALEAAVEFERMLDKMDEFLADPDMEIPKELRRYAETQPGRDNCHFFERTNCCRYGIPCIYNHRRPLLSRIIIIRHFFSHPHQQMEHHEYGSDMLLEFSDSDLREAYQEFFDDVVPEMESFGDIVNFRTVANSQPYLRGHVFVEYTNERSALKAFIKLQGRYYAAKRLNVEFSNITVWRTAVCGLSIARKCPQGRNCLYLHLFSNPKNKYNMILEVTGKKQQLTTPLISWADLDKNFESTPDSMRQTLNKRWSESPEMELKSRAPIDNAANNETSRKSSDETKPRRRSKSKGADKRHEKEYKHNRSRSPKCQDRSRSHKRQKRSRTRSPKSYKRNGSRSPRRLSRKTRCNSSHDRANRKSCLAEDKD